MTDSKQSIKYLCIAWTIVIGFFYIMSTYLAWNMVSMDKKKSEKRHKNRVEVMGEEAGRTKVNFSQLKEPNQALTAKIFTGIYIDRIVELSTKGTSWTVDFYIWFKWKEDGIKPGEGFQIINGDMLSKTKVASTSRNGEYYEQYRITAKITKFFNITRYPLDNHLLTIRIEDKNNTWPAVQYVVDEKESTYSSRVHVPGYNIQKTTLVEKLHAYKTNRGNPGITSEQAIYSQVIYGLFISRPGWGLYVKMFQGLFASVAIAFLAFFFETGGGNRVSLGVGAFFASVASSYISLNELPGSGIHTLTDIINGMGMVTIFLTLLSTLIAIQMDRNKIPHSTIRLFDTLSVVIFISGYILFNLIVSMASASF